MLEIRFEIEAPQMAGRALSARRHDAGNGNGGDIHESQAFCWAAPYALIAMGAERQYGVARIMTCQ